VADTVIRQPLKAPVRLIKGSHIVVRRRFAHDFGYIFQVADGRVVFALPFGDEFTLIGTTDENFVGDLKALAPDPDEITYLCDAVNQYFREQVTPDELVWSTTMAPTSPRASPAITSLCSTRSWARRRC